MLARDGAAAESGTNVGGATTAGAGARAGAGEGDTSDAGGGENCGGGATLSGTGTLRATLAGGLSRALAGGILAVENVLVQATIDEANAIRSAAREICCSA